MLPSAETAWYLPLTKGGVCVELALVFDKVHGIGKQPFNQVKGCLLKVHMSDWAGHEEKVNTRLDRLRSQHSSESY
jgi:hypothetical protein